MFTHWKKRGAYELEALPASLGQGGGAERYSWSSSLDLNHDLCGKPSCEEKSPVWEGSDVAQGHLLSAVPPDLCHYWRGSDNTGPGGMFLVLSSLPAAWK
ncbi:unnamed protein product [Pleuronectes platessa]|uniref:Uncharacterized protein n=1 Tax=Pleuronectes platessa TaxID=8262 RepID=A0A9N7UWG3_PLEPL|nr:unnamed protein product [Pleuronectes platessa]